MAEAQRSQADLLTVWPTQITQTWQQVREGFAKNILAGHGNHLTFLLFSIFFPQLALCLPFDSPDARPHRRHLAPTHNGRPAHAYLRAADDHDRLAIHLLALQRRPTLERTNPPHPMNSILILGAGIGGLSAAIHLAAKGQPVTLLEQNPSLGGKMAEIQAAGYRWDTGPPSSPCAQFLKTSFGPPTANLEDYLSFLAEAARLHRITGPVFTYGPPPSLASLTKVSLADALSVDVLHSLQHSIERRIHDPHLRQLLGRFATYVGASPYLAPATLGVIAHVELTEGVWYPQGGIYSIARAYEKLARELGVQIRTNTRVKEICLHDRRVSALILENGEILPAQTVISNLDVTSAYSLIQSEHATRRLEALKQSQVSCSGVMLLLGLAGLHPELAHHNIFFSSNYRREFEQIFSEQVLPNEPTLYLCITSKTDPSHVPTGGENWFVMANAPAMARGPARELDKAAVTEKLLNRLASLGLDVRNQIRYQQLLTPLELQQKTGAHRGALYGVSFNDRFAPFKRPNNRSPFKGLYFAGGSTHPGGGVPLVTLSGKLAAEMIELNEQE